MNGILKSIALVAIVSFFLSGCGGESSGESSGTMTTGSGLDTSQLSPAALRGHDIFVDPSYGCVSCHGLQGEGTSAGGPLNAVSPTACSSCGDLATLTTLNDLTMPMTPYMPSSCTGACASDVSEFIIEGFIQGLATGNTPPPPATPALNITGANNFATTEGANSSFMISLATQPSDTVTVDFAVSDANEATMAQTSYSILPADWQTPVTITVMGVDDVVLDPTAATAYTIAVTTSSNDADYNALTIAPISATNNDNELAGQGQFVFDKTMGLLTSEDATSDTFTIALNTMPTQDVTVSLSSSNALEGTVNPATFTFNAGNFSTPQVFTVTGVNDATPTIDGPIAYNIVVTATTTDRAYMGVDPSDVMATNQDNDVQVVINNFASDAVGNLPFGSNVVLTWDSDGESCTASATPANAQWTGALNASGNLTVTNLTQTTAFNITCSNAANAVPATATVNVVVDAQLGAPVVNLNANPTTVDYNGSSTLTWTTTDAASCSATSVPANAAWDNANKAVNNAVGELIGPLTATTTFSLTCTNASTLTTTAQATVTVNPAMPSLTFSANNMTVNTGDPVTLNWNTVDLASCTASANPVNAEWTGAKGVLPTNSQTINNMTATTTFTLACTGIDNSVVAPQDVTVTVNAGDPILIQGQVEYKRLVNGESCETCHGTDGRGILSDGLYDDITDYVNNMPEGTVIFYTEFLMPRPEAGTGGMPSDCVDTPGDGNALNDCATNVTKYMQNGFSVVPPAQ